MLHSLWDLSSPTRDRTLGSESTESWTTREFPIFNKVEQNYILACLRL